jgi:hypothetical protein
MTDVEDICYHCGYPLLAADRQPTCPECGMRNAHADTQAGIPYVHLQQAHRAVLLLVACFPLWAVVVIYLLPQALVGGFGPGRVADAWLLELLERGALVALSLLTAGALLMLVRGPLGRTWCSPALRAAVHALAAALVILLGIALCQPGGRVLRVSVNALASYAALTTLGGLWLAGLWVLRAHADAIMAEKLHRQIRRRWWLLAGCLALAASLAFFVLIEPSFPPAVRFGSANTTSLSSTALALAMILCLPITAMFHLTAFRVWWSVRQSMRAMQPQLAF